MGQAAGHEACGTPCCRSQRESDAVGDDKPRQVWHGDLLVSSSGTVECQRLLSDAAKASCSTATFQEGCTQYNTEASSTTVPEHGPAEMIKAVDEQLELQSVPDLPEVEPASPTRASAEVPDVPELAPEVAVPPHEEAKKPARRAKSAPSRKSAGPKQAQKKEEKDKVERDEFGRDIKRLQAARGGGAAGRGQESESSSSDEDPLNCPASRQKTKAFEKDLKALKKKIREGKTEDELQEMDNPWATTMVSDSERKLKKDMFVSFYREQYRRIGKAAAAAPKVDHYSKAETAGLKITDGHRPMPRPRGVALPKDFRKPVGTLSALKLAEYNCDNQRKLVSIHGDLFDVSDRPDKYSKDGPYSYMCGHDMTWGLVFGDDSEEHLDKYYDLFKIQPPELRDRKLQGLMSWWAFYEKEYGDPVGRLDTYQKEWGLPAPPTQGLDDVCAVM